MGRDEGGRMEMGEVNVMRSFARRRDDLIITISETSSALAREMWRDAVQNSWSIRRSDDSPLGASFHLARFRRHLLAPITSPACPS